MVDLTAQIKSSFADAILRRPPGLYARVRRALADWDRSDLAERRRLRDERLEAVLGAARKTPYHRQRGAAAAPHDLSQFPVLGRDDVQGHEHEFVVPGRRITVPAQTGGSSGRPLKLTRSLASIIAEQATIDHIAAVGAGDRPGIDLAKARIAVLRGDSIKDPNELEPPFWRQSSPRKTVFSVHHLRRATYGAYAQALAQFRPQVLYAYPSAVEQLLSLYGGEAWARDLELVLTSSEVVPAGLRGRVGETFGIPLVDYYGQAERVSFAWSSEDGRYRFRGDYAWVEFGAPEGEAVPLIATGFSNLVQPFVRYDAGDTVLLGAPADAAAREAIALGLSPFQAIVGRASEYVRLPDGGRIIGLNHIPRGLDGLSSVQIVQDALDHVTVVAVPSSAYNDAALLQLKHNVRAKIPEIVKIDYTIEETPVRLANGKSPLFINHIAS